MDGAAFAALSRSFFVCFGSVVVDVGVAAPDPETPFGVSPLASFPCFSFSSLRFLRFSNRIFSCSRSVLPSLRSVSGTDDGNRTVVCGSGMGSGGGVRGLWMPSA